MANSVDLGTLVAGVILGSMAHKSIKKLTNTGLVLSAGLLQSAAVAAATAVDTKAAEKAAEAVDSTVQATAGQKKGK